MTGDLVHSGSDFALTVRYGSQPGVTLKQPAGALDELVQKSAEHIFFAARPYRFADYLVHEQRYAEAEAIVPPLAERGSAEDRALAYSAWAEIEFYRGDMHAALQKGAEAVRLNPQSPLTHLWQGATAGNVGHEEESWSSVSEGTRLLDNGGADNVDPLVIALSPEFRGYAAENVGDFGQAVHAYTELRGSDPDAWRTNLGNEVGDLSSAHDLKAARALLRSIPATLPRDGKPDADRFQAPFYIAFNASDWPATVRAAAAADSVFAGLRSVQSERRFNLWPQWAYATAMNGDMAGAERLIAKTTTDCDLCMRMRGRIAALKRDWGGAARDFGIVAARSPHIPFAETDWGETLLRKGDYDGAIEKLQAANKIGPHFADPLEMWGEALIAKNRSDLALAKFEEADKYAPNWGRLHLKWGEALLWSGKRDDAAKQFAAAAKLDLTPSEKSELVRVSHG